MKGAALGLLFCVLLAPLPAQAIRLAADDDTFIDFRVLLQAWGHFLEEGAPDGESLGKELYLRRIRFMASGQVNEQLSFTFGIDSPNYGRENFVADVFVFDAYASYAFARELKVDAGLFITPFVHHGLQAVASLTTVDLRLPAIRFPAAANRLRRDVGVQARGLILGDRLEYRTGIFRGVRGAPAGAEPPVGTEGLNPEDAPRLAGSLRLNFLEPEEAFVYQGLYFGTKRVLSVGVAGDWQQDAARSAGGALEDYGAVGVDLFLDLPFDGGRQEIVAQAAVMDWRQGEGAPDTGVSWFAEAGYRYREVLPYLVYEHFDSDAGAAQDYEAFRFGVGWWFEGATANLKFEGARIEPGLADGRWEAIVQLQLFP